MPDLLRRAARATRVMAESVRADRPKIISLPQAAKSDTRSQSATVSAVFQGINVNGSPAVARSGFVGELIADQRNRL